EASRDIANFSALYSARQKSKSPPVWQRLQLAKSSPPKARLPLWQVAQFVPRADAKCIMPRGAVTWLPFGIFFITGWHVAQPTREWLEWLKLAGIAATPPRRGPGWPGSWQVVQDAMSLPSAAFASGLWH